MSAGLARDRKATNVISESKRKDAEAMHAAGETQVTGREPRTMGGMRVPRAVSAALVAAVALLSALAIPASASATIGIDSFDAPVLDAADAPETQAGIHPFRANNAVSVSVDPDTQMPTESVKDIVVELPVGFVGDPSDLPTCNRVDLSMLSCEPSAQVGTITVTVGLVPGMAMPYTSPVFNMEVPKGQPAQFGTEVLLGSALVFLDASIRPEDSGITVTSSDTSHFLAVFGTDLDFWGVPADPSHDAQRGYPITGYVPTCTYYGTATPPCKAGVERKPFLRNVTACGEPQVTKVHVNSWQHPDSWAHETFTGPAATDCDVLDFQPGVKVQPQNTTAGSPSAYTVEVSQQLDDSPDALATADLKDATVTLPEGVAINPSAAGGLEACSEAQIGLGEAGDPACPAHSTIGRIEIDTPTLNEPLKGPIYQAKQDQNPFGSTLAIYMAPKSDRYGVQLKLAGEIATDPDTGQVTTSFADNPQLPFSELKMTLKGGKRAVLSNPPTCGAKTTEWSLASYAQPNDPVEGTDTFTIDQSPNNGPCPTTTASQPYSPTVSAGLINPAAGSSSPFVFHLKREDGAQEIRDLTITPPEGVSAYLKDAELCADSDIPPSGIGSADCSAYSKIGSVQVAAGSGTPYWVKGGDAYLAGPYEGAPLSLVIEVPAVAGPFDLGEVTVRSAIDVDKRTAQLTIASDRIPRILEGIPLQIRDIRVAIDKPGFMSSPTSCDPLQITGESTSYGNKSAELAGRFQMGDCANLDFSPKLKLNYRGKGSKKRNSHPRLAANLKIPQGSLDPAQANLDKVRVVLPRGTYLDQAALSRVCTPTQWDAGDCPADSKIGNAKAYSPLLAEPLRGPVYLKVGPNELPDLAVDLDGIIDIDLLAKIDSRGNRIRNTFQIVPDVPVSKFKLNIKGGNGGLLVNSKDICKGRKALWRANVAMRAHNAAKLKDKQSVVRCGKRGRR